MMITTKDLPVQMKGGNFGIVTLIVGEIKMIWQRLLFAWKSAIKKTKTVISL